MATTIIVPVVRDKYAASKSNAGNTDGVSQSVYPTPYPGKPFQTQFISNPATRDATSSTFSYFPTTYSSSDTVITTDTAAGVMFKMTA